MLRDYDCVELVRTEPRRGALQHFYRATARPTLDRDQWRAVPSGLRRELSDETLHRLIGDLGDAADAGALDDPEVVVTRATLELDERGWRKLNTLLGRTVDQAARIAEESADRSARSTAARLPTELAVLHFKRGRPRSAA